MIIVLKEADFSANNVGKITMPISDFTLAAITASGKSNMTDNEKSALDTFFKSVGAVDNNGIWTKLDKVYLPFIGADVTYGLVNYKGNNKDAALSSEYMKLEKGGVKTVKIDSKTTAAEANNIVPNYVWDWSSKSVLFLNTEDIPTEERLYSLNVIAYTTNWQNVTFGRSSAGYIILQATASNTQIFEAYSDIASKDVIVPAGNIFGLTVNTSTAKVTKIDGTLGNVRNYSAPTPVTTPETLYPFSDSPNGSVSRNTIGTGAIILGSYLDDTEYTTLMSELKTLYSVFKTEEGW